MAEYVKNKGYQKKGTALFGDNGALANIAVNGDIPIFQTQINNDSQSIIKNNNYEITIKAGKKVYLDSSTAFVITSAGIVTFRFYNKTTSQYIGVRGQAFTTTFSSANVSSSTNARAEISPTVDTVISCKVEALTGGPTISMDTNSTRVEEVESLLSETLGQTTFQDAVFNGFTQLGESAPKIKMKKLTGTTASTEGGSAGVAHGLTSSKIISFTGVIHIDSTTSMPLGYKPETSGNQGFEVHCYVSGSGFNIINHATNSENALSKPFTIIVWYEE